MDREIFDTDLFNDEIEKKPSIQNMTSNQYLNKISKRNAWKKLLSCFGIQVILKKENKCHGKYF